MAVGRKTGGRQTGTPNKATVAAREGLQRLLDEGCDPYRALYDLAHQAETPLDKRVEILSRLLRVTYAELVPKSECGEAGGEGLRKLIVIDLDA